MWLQAAAFLPWLSRAPGARGAQSQWVLAIISASCEILLQLKLLTVAGRSLSTCIQTQSSWSHGAWLTELSIQSRETSRVCAFAILHPGALESGLSKR